MSRRLAGNVIWNWSGMAVTMVTGFIVAPVLVHRLTDSVYGLWILIASMSGYFGLLDLGVRGSVGRYIAFYRARGEQRQMNVTLSTAVTILTGVAVLTLLATLLVLLVFFHLFDVPEVYVGAARLAIIIIGINLAITFPVSVFDGVLWGHERFDLLNAADIPVSLLRLVLTVWLVQGPNDIVTLAWITLLTTAGNELAKVVMSFRINPGLRLSFRLFERASAVQLYGYGLWQFVLQIARQIGGQLGPLLIGGIVSVSAVTPYSIASRLITYLSQFIVAATGVLTPLATTLHARSDVEREQQLYVQGGKWCISLALLAGAAIALLGGALLKLWMGPRFVPAAYPMLLVLTVGEVLPMSQWLTYSILLGKARHRAVAMASLAEGLIAALGGVWAARHFGAMGVCVVFAAASFALRGAFLLMYGSRVLSVPLMRYMAGAVMPAIEAAVLPVGLLVLAMMWHTPTTWVQLAVYATAFGVAHAGSAVWFLGAGKYLRTKLEALYGRSEQVALAQTAEDAHV